MMILHLRALWTVENGSDLALPTKDSQVAAGCITQKKITLTKPWTRGLGFFELPWIVIFSFGSLVGNTCLGNLGFGKTFRLAEFPVTWKTEASQYERWKECGFQAISRLVQR